MPVIRIAEIPNAGPRAVGASSANIGVPQFGGMAVNPQVAQLDGAAALSDTSIRRSAQSMLDQTLEQDAFTAEAEAGMRLGQSIGQLGQMTQQMAEKFGKAKDTADLARAETTMRAAFEKQQNEQLDLPVDQWEENWTRNLEMTRKALGEIKISNNAAGELMPSWQRWSELSVLQIKNQARKKQVEGYQMDVDANAMMKVASDDLTGAFAIYDRAEKDGIFAPGESKMRKAKLYDDQIRMAKEQNVNRLIGEMNTNPDELLPLLQRRSRGEDVPELGDITPVQATTMANNTEGVIRGRIADSDDAADQAILTGEIKTKEELREKFPNLPERRLLTHEGTMAQVYENSPQRWAEVTAMRPKLLTTIEGYDANKDPEWAEYYKIKDTINQGMPPGERAEFLGLLSEQRREGRKQPQPVRDALSTLSTLSDKGYFGAIDPKKLGSANEAVRNAETNKLLESGVRHMEKRQLLETWAKENPAKAKDPEAVRTFLRHMMDPDTTDKAIDIFNNTVTQSETEQAAADVLDFGQREGFGTSVVPGLAPIARQPSSVPSQEPGPVKSPSAKSSGPVRRDPNANQSAYAVWDAVTAKHGGLEFLGIWGDAKHRKRKSDHNTGDAIDIGIANTAQGNKVADDIIAMAGANNVKYLIFNKQIWKPDTGWKPHKGNAHSGHVHVSFNRGAAGPMVASD